MIWCRLQIENWSQPHSVFTLTTIEKICGCINLQPVDKMLVNVCGFLNFFWSDNSYQLILILLMNIYISTFYKEPKVRQALYLIETLEMLKRVEYRPAVYGWDQKCVKYCFYSINQLTKWIYLQKKLNFFSLSISLHSSMILKIK